jgi:hypothetical protein
VTVNLDDLQNKKLVIRGLTAAFAAKLAGFGNYKTYQQAKKAVKNGIPELVAAVPQKISIYRAFQISQYPREEQPDLLKQELESSSKIKAAREAKSEKGANKWKRINSANGDAKQGTEEKTCARCESLTMLALFQAGLFQERKERVNEQNQPLEEETTLQKTFSK